MTVRDIVMAAAGGQSVVVGQVAYTTAGTYSWTCPAGVTSVSVVCVGSTTINPYFASAFGGAGLGYKNNITVVPGTSYTVVVGTDGTDSYFIDTSTVKGGGTTSHTGGTYVGTGGGNGGTAGESGFGGGGGAGGYSGNGGDGGASNQSGASGSGGGGGGGGCAYQSGRQRYHSSGGGGGVGLLGEGSSGSGGSFSGATAYGGSGGSSGTAGQTLTSPVLGEVWGTGGEYGGGGRSGKGAVRIIWPGTTRQFPSTNTGDM